MPEPLPHMPSQPHNLAIAYAPKAQQDWLDLMLAFDARMAAVVIQAKEPIIAQMRFAWWRENLAKPEQHRPQGEPLLRLLATLDPPMASGAMQPLVDAWELLLNDPWQHDVISEHAKLRAQVVFKGYADACSSNLDVVEIGTSWALADLARRFPTMAQTTVAANTLTVQGFQKLPRQLRPLAILHYAASVEAERMVDGKRQRRRALRLMFGALTGH